jgi:hypothetical protein
MDSTFVLFYFLCSTEGFFFLKKIKIKIWCLFCRVPFLYLLYNNLLQFQKKKKIIDSKIMEFKSFFALNSKQD